MKKISVTALLLLCLAGIAKQSLAADITLHALSIKGLFQDDQQGRYDQIINRLRPDIAHNINIMHQPAAKAFTAFETCQDCCISPANMNPEFYSYQQGFIETQPLGQADIYIWSPPGKAPLSTIDDLTGKKVGARIGFPYGKSVEQKLNLQRVANIETNIYLLESGRIDAMIDYTPDTDVIFEQLNKPPFPHNRNTPLLSHKDNILCHDTPKTRAFVTHFNQAIKNIKH